LLTRQTIAPPVGPPVTRSFARTVTLAEPTLPLSITAQTDTITVGAAVSTAAWDAPTRTFTFTTPEGRQATLGVDLARRATLQQTAGIAPRAWTFDAQGRL